MATVSLPYTLQAGQPENVNQLVANLNALVAGVNTVDTAQIANGAVTSDKIAALPYAELTQSATGIADNTFVTPNLTSATYDNGVATCGTALADLANERLYLRRVGVWVIHAHASWATNGTGYRDVELFVNNGSAVKISQELNNNFGGVFGTEQSAVGLWYATATTDYAYPIVYQNSGGSLNCTVTLKATWLGKYS